MSQKPLSETERDAIAYLENKGGSMLVSRVPDKNERGDFGEVIPGMTVYRKLERRGLITITEEEGDYTPAIELRRDALRQFEEERSSDDEAQRGRGLS
jgi:hypothetical protein